ncbi:hypothetical protein FLAG1_03209 [Fusarium langsethiae]|uniref:Uncharacterized protein n=1 Tax=Fusarium langsethiae TaxID=179993 RepID=A0A0N0DGC8_FUSLA|nr:hypothetical protein FLAG1_03209 [Fusarium langsethiae]GKU01076.1 unnamed protein product [Fusarium langsethiae]GKU13630.1 unnamed protein product [Fusarium langsethiae]
MMSVAPQEFQSQSYYYLPYRPVSSHRQPQQQNVSYFNITNLNHSPTLDFTTTAAMAATAAANARSQQDASVAQALEIARESPDGSSDPTISKILEGALARIWSKVTEHPDSYVMTRDEFAVFNFFQHRFIGNKMALNARKRFWDNTHA